MSIALQGKYLHVEEAQRIIEQQRPKEFDYTIQEIGFVSMVAALCLTEVAFVSLEALSGTVLSSSLKSTTYIVSAVFAGTVGFCGTLSRHEQQIRAFNKTKEILKGRLSYEPVVGKDLALLIEKSTQKLWPLITKKAHLSQLLEAQQATDSVKVKKYLEKIISSHHADEIQQTHNSVDPYLKSLKDLLTAIEKHTPSCDSTKTSEDVESQEEDSYEFLEICKAYNDCIDILKGSANRYISEFLISHLTKKNANAIHRFAQYAGIDTLIAASLTKSKEDQKFFAIGR